jgi:hypothetical protein
MGPLGMGPGRATQAQAAEPCTGAARLQLRLRIATRHTAQLQVRVANPLEWLLEVI